MFSDSASPHTLAADFEWCERVRARVRVRARFGVLLCFCLPATGRTISGGGARKALIPEHRESLVACGAVVQRRVRVRCELPASGGLGRRDGSMMPVHEPEHDETRKEEYGANDRAGAAHGRRTVAAHLVRPEREATRPARLLCRGLHR